jgi:hypothetical protein
MIFARMTSRYGDVYAARASASRSASIRLDAIRARPGHDSLALLGGDATAERDSSIIYVITLTNMSRPGQVGYYYLYVLLDIFRRYVVGWPLARRAAPPDKVLIARLTAGSGGGNRLAPSRIRNEPGRDYPFGTAEASSKTRAPSAIRRNGVATRR